MSDKQRYQEILRGVRSDLKYLETTLYGELVNKIRNEGYTVDDEIKEWIFDVFLDKVYETNAKIIKIFEDFGLRDVKLPLGNIRQSAQQLAYTAQYNVRSDLHGLYFPIEYYGRAVEKAMSSVRNFLHRTDWAKMENIKSEDYILPVKRAKYVKARDELQKAQQAVKNKKWDEVLNHLRPAIDLALRERFGFKKIFPMKQFLLDAKNNNLPIPSYDMIYYYFDEGSHRIHEGKLHTPWECENALGFVAGFIDRLDLISVSKEDIQKFKISSKAVE